MADQVLTASGASSGRTGWLATGGMIGALLASSCCVVPLVLVSIGISGAWIGNLTVLEPYRPIFSAVALLCIGLGFGNAYFRKSGACGTQRSVRITKAVLWLAAVLTLVALTTGLWAPLFY